MKNLIVFLLVFVPCNPGNAQLSLGFEMGFREYQIKQWYHRENEFGFPFSFSADYRFNRFFSGGVGLSKHYLQYESSMNLPIDQFFKTLRLPNTALPTEKDYTLINIHTTRDYYHFPLRLTLYPVGNPKARWQPYVSLQAAFRIGQESKVETTYEKPYERSGSYTGSSLGTFLFVLFAVISGPDDLKVYRTSFSEAVNTQLEEETGLPIYWSLDVGHQFSLDQRITLHTEASLGINGKKIESPKNGINVGIKCLLGKLPR